MCLSFPVVKGNKSIIQSVGFSHILNIVHQTCGCKVLSLFEEKNSTGTCEVLTMLKLDHNDLEKLKVLRKQKVDLCVCVCVCVCAIKSPSVSHKPAAFAFV